jgi:glycosyltransferase 2 family protein
LSYVADAGAIRYQVIQILAQQPSGLPLHEGGGPGSPEAAPAASAPADPRAALVTSRRPLIQRALEIGISLVFLVLALRGVSFPELWAQLRQANYVWLLPAVATTMAVLLLKGWRWQLLFLPEYHLPFGPVFSALCAGYLVSNVLPARLGELARLVLLVGEQPVSVARTFSTIVIERVLDVLTLLIMFVLILPFLNVQLPPEVLRAAQIGVVLVLIGAGLVVLLSPLKGMLMRWAHAILGKVRFLDRKGIYDAIENLIDGFVALRSPLGLLLVGQSLVSWFGVVFMAWCSAQAVGLHVPLTALVLVVVVTTLGMLLPSTPGYLGVFEYLTTVSLLPFGVSKDVAFGFALVFHITNYLTMSVAGVMALWVHGTSFSRVVEGLRRRAETLNG